MRKSRKNLNIEKLVKNLEEFGYRVTKRNLSKGRIRIVATPKKVTHRFTIEPYGALEVSEDDEVALKLIRIFWREEYA